MLYSCYRFGRFLALKLRIETCYKVAVFFADIYYTLAKSDRKNLECNLEVVLGTPDKKLIKKHIKNVFRNFAKYLADFFRFSEISKDYILSRVTLRGKENLDKALARGKGAIALTAHIGNWELGGAVVSTLGYPLYAIALDHKDKRINDFFLEQRASCDVNVIPIGLRLKNCFRLLRQNKILAIVGDRDFSNHGVQEDFFGRPTVLPRGPAVFCLRTDAAIIPTFLLRKEGDNFDFIFEKPIYKTDTGNEAADLKNILRRYISVIEKYIKDYPDQWYAFRKMWN